MRISPLLMAGALLFWGWETGIIWLAMGMAVCFELSHIFKWRLDFSETDYNRVFDLCVLLVLGAGAYCYISRDTTNELMEFLRGVDHGARAKNVSAAEAVQTAYIWFQWLPMALFPMALAQAFGTADRIPMTAFSWYVRKYHKEHPRAEVIAINILPAYFAITLMGASAANNRTIWFYIGFSVLVGWALWFARSRRFSALAWLVTLILVVKAGHFGHSRLNALQASVEGTVSEWIAKMMRGDSNAGESRTAIGRIGRVKQSGQVIFRLEAKGEPPPLIRDSSYNVFEQTLWYIPERSFTDLVVDNDTTTWSIMPPKEPKQEINLYAYLQKGRLILPVPTGTYELGNLPVAAVKTNRFGAVRAQEGPGLVGVRMSYSPGRTFDKPPEDIDYHGVPEREKPALDQVIKEMKLQQLATVEQKLRAVADFFNNNFTYTTYLTGNALANNGESTPISKFLLKTRAGHCEYFGTATVLILRRAGIAARYANGYSVQEKESFRKRYVIRGRHAHAWCIYFDEKEKTWKDFDTTPADWSNQEEKNASLFEPLTDISSRAWFEFSKWRWLGEKGDYRTYLVWILVPMIGYMMWRLVFKRKFSRSKAGDKTTKKPIHWPGLDSELYLAEKRLQELGLERYPGEALTVWFRRLEKVPNVSVKPLLELLRLHYRYRFDPKGIKSGEREQLRNGVLTWLRESKSAG